MLSFAKAELSLSVREQDGHSKKEHLLSAWRQTGVMPDELAAVPPCPQQLEYLWAYFLELHQTRGNNGFGPSCITYAEIDAWRRLLQRSLDPWEINALLKLDAAYIASQPKPS